MIITVETTQLIEWAASSLAAVFLVMLLCDGIADMVISAVSGGEKKRDVG